MYDVIIIGGGPAGMAVALNTLRNGRTCLLLEKENFGGQMATSPKLENIPGIKAISGIEYSDKMFEQITDMGAEFELEEVEQITKEDEKFIVKTNYNTYESWVVVLANGCHHRKMNLPHEDELVGKGISYCAVCDGAFYKGQTTNIIGDANTALQYALLLSNYCPTVNIFALFDHLFGDQILIQRINDNPNINVTYNVSLQEFVGEDELKGLRFFDKANKQEFLVKTNNVFVAIGQIPCNEPFKDLVELDARGFVIANDDMETSCAGVYAVGDTRVKDIRQVVTALGDASVASVYINRYIQSLNRND
jgi:thioredoxin reductase (NADPH)